MDALNCKAKEANHFDVGKLQRRNGFSCSNHLIFFIFLANKIIKVLI